MSVLRIDPIVVKEARARFETKRCLLAVSDDAAAALLWFKEYADGRSVADVMIIDVRAIAGSTQGVASAMKYVQEAARQHADAILAAAVAAANADFVKAEAKP